MKKLSSFLIARRQFLSTHNKQALQQYDTVNLPVHILQHHNIVHQWRYLLFERVFFYRCLFLVSISWLTLSMQKFIEYEKKEIQRTLDLPQSNTDPIALIFQYALPRYSRSFALYLSSLVL